jgi:predicted lipoprotein with Yx(FWY)xxD motif
VPPPAPVLTKVKLRAARNKTLNTMILISPSGRTLYHMTAEKGKKIVCTGQCAQFWPPLLIKRGTKATAGTDLDAKKLGTIKRPDGRLQVTYAGLPLYTFASDKRTGDVNGEGVERVWYAVSPSGKIVKRASVE